MFIASAPGLVLNDKDSRSGLWTWVQIPTSSKKLYGKDSMAENITKHKNSQTGQAAPYKYFKIIVIVTSNYLIKGQYIIFHSSYGNLIYYFRK